MRRFCGHARLLLALFIASLTGGLALVSSNPAYGAEGDPTVKGAISNAAAFLRENIVNSSGVRRNLAALALLLADEPADSKLIVDSVEQIRSLIKDGQYIPKGGDHHLYGAGVNATLLADIDTKRFRPELEAISQYVIGLQGADGSWDYPNRRTVGDTSISQYAMLALWAAERAEVSIPQEVYQKAVAWHQKTQNRGGGFSYHPGTNEGVEMGVPTLTNTAAGTGSLLIARMFLRPNAGTGKWDQSYRRKKSAVDTKPAVESEPADSTKPVLRKFRFLRKVDLDKDPAETKKRTGPSLSFDPTIEKSVGWLAVNFRDRGTNPHRIYYYYTLERMSALGNIRTLGSHDWYQECSNVLLQTQNKDGSFDTFSGPHVGTSLAILFLTKSTAKVLGRPRVGERNVGIGLMAGGRGLPDDLTTVRMKNGKVELARKVGPFDTLLAELENPKSLDIDTTQKAIVEKIQLGDRKALIGQIDRLKKLVDHPQADVRRTAIWALGHSGDLQLVPLLLQALEDPDVDVMVEARNALCWISRKPLGFGLSPVLFTGDSKNMEKSERSRAIVKWRTAVVRRGRTWYRQVRRYEDRVELFDSVGRKR